MIILNVKEAYKQALRDRNAVAKATLSTLIGEADKVAKDARVEVIDDASLISMIKKHMDSATETMNILSARGQDNSVERESLAILSKFMPSRMSDEEVVETLRGFKQSGMNKGIAMKTMREKFAGRYDGAFAAKAFDTV